MQITHFNSADPIARARNVEGIVEVLREFCESEADKVLDPEARSLFEGTAHILEGVSRDFQNFLTRDHVPWEKYEETDFHKSIDPWD